MTTFPYIREADNNDETEIARIEKNQSQDIRVCLCEQHGQMCVDVRIYAEDNGKGIRVATPKGVNLKVGQLPKLVDALLAAERVWRGRPE